MITRNSWMRGLALEIVGGTILLAVLFGLRLWNLEADPPSDLAISSSVFTDPAQYVHYARQYVETGDINPYGDFRQPFFVKSTITLAAIGVFKLLGYGLWQANLVGVLFSFASLSLFFLFVRRTGGRMAGWLFLVMIGLDYNLLFFGQLPFLEHAMQFWAALALVLLVYSRKTIAQIGAGGSLAIGIFFGKIIGLIFLAPFACLLIHQAVSASDTSRWPRWRPTLAFAGGFSLVGLVWLFFGYLSMPDHVTGYVSEQALELYGAPEAFQSVGNFLWAMVSFGVFSNLFPRMALVAVTGVSLILVVLHHAVQAESWRRGCARLTGGQIFVVAAIIAFFGALMIWNYRPLRYELALIYPFYAAAAMILAMLWHRLRPIQSSGVNWPFFPICFVVVMVVVAQLLAGLADDVGLTFAWEEDKATVMLAAALITASIGLFVKLYGSGRLKVSAVVVRAAVILVPLVVVGNSVTEYVEAQQNRTFTLRDNAQDLSVLLGDNAVLSGPFGPAMALVSGHQSIIHMFGAPHVDATLFERFPITHLLMDRDNADKAFDCHPKIMNSSHHVCTYHIGSADVSLFRIAGQTCNGAADTYQPSILEQAIDLRAGGDYRAARTLTEAFVLQYPDNITANLLLAELCEKQGDFHLAEFFVTKALQFSPSNRHLNATLATFYGGRYRATGDEQYRAKAVTHFREALRLAAQPIRQEAIRGELLRLGVDPRID